MAQSIAHVALVVCDYDEAIAWFADKLDFTLVADDYQPEQDQRWVLVAPAGASQESTSLLLARASGPEQAAVIGISRAAASSCSCAPTISGGITTGW